jgi:ADP-ribose pyrophosphatase
LNGGHSKREIVEHPGGVAIIGITDEKEIVLVEQFRKPIDRMLLELPAGKIEKNEPPELTAKRELQEETGYIAEEVELLLEGYSSPGFSDEKIYIYLAKNLVQGEPCPDENEHIDIKKYKLDVLIKMVFTGQIEDYKTISGLLALQVKGDLV